MGTGARVWEKPEINKLFQVDTTNHKGERWENFGRKMKGSGLELLSLELLRCLNVTLLDESDVHWTLGSGARMRAFDGDSIWESLLYRR